MFFGLSNELVSFQGNINKILAKKLNIFVIVYFDDIVIYTENPSQAHIDAVSWIFEKLRKYGFFSNLKKG